MPFGGHEFGLLTAGGGEAVCVVSHFRLALIVQSSLVFPTNAKAKLTRLLYSGLFHREGYQYQTHQFPVVFLFTMNYNIIIFSSAHQDDHVIMSSSCSRPS